MFSIYINNRDNAPFSSVFCRLGVSCYVCDGLLKSHGAVFHKEKYIIDNKMECCDPLCKEVRLWLNLSCFSPFITDESVFNFFDCDGFYLPTDKSSRDDYLEKRLNRARKAMGLYSSNSTFRSMLRDKFAYKSESKSFEDLSVHVMLDMSRESDRVRRS